MRYFLAVVMVLQDKEKSKISKLTVEINQI